MNQAQAPFHPLCTYYEILNSVVPLVANDFQTFSLCFLKQVSSTIQVSTPRQSIDIVLTSTLQENKIVSRTHKTLLDHVDM